MKLLRIATRNSPLALWQANFVKEKLIELEPELAVDVIGMTTKGDQLLDRSLAAVGGKGLFLKELEMSLLNQETDIAVHSMKDVPVTLPEGLEISVVCAREDARDAFVSNQYQNFYALPEGSRVGTSSLRRVAQLKNIFPSLEFVELRGNVNTRLSKLDAGHYDAIILAAAGLIRLGMEERIKQYIPQRVCLSAVGQGIVGIECRSDDDATKAIINQLHNRKSAITIAAERAMNAKLEGGCQVPIAGYAEIDKGKIHMRGVVGSVDGGQCLKSDISQTGMTIENAIKIGESVADDLLKQGADDILESFYSESVEAELVESKPVQVESKEELEKTGKPLVILTREQKYLGNVASLLESLDFRSEHIPAIETLPYNATEISNAMKGLHRFTDILFVSRNSVEVATPLLQKKPLLPVTTQIMTVGPETAKQLYQHGIDALFPDNGTGAEALLKVQQLQDLQDRKILIIRGEKGLDWPAKKMRERGAEVHSLKCYNQIKPVGLESQIDDLKEINSEIAGVFIHSSLAARNIIPHLVQYLGEFPDKAKQTKLIVGSKEIAEVAKELGWREKAVIAQSPSNKHMMIAFSS